MVKRKATTTSNETSKISDNIFISILALIIIVSVWTFTKDLITPILVGFIFAILTYPIYTFFKTQFQRVLPNLASSLSGTTTLIIVSIVIISILNFFFSQLQKELPLFTRGLSDFIISLPKNQLIINTFNLNETQAKNLSDSINQGVSTIQTRFWGSGAVLQTLFEEQNISKTLDFGQKTVAQLSSFIISLLFFLFVWHNSLVNGKKWQKNILSLFPFSEIERTSIRKDIQNAVRNVIYTELGAGLIHSIFVFTLLSIFGIENRFIITFIVLLIGVLPLSPAEFAYAIPISLIFPKNPMAAILIIPLAEAVILWINFVYRPKMIAATNNANPILVLASIFSGIAIFGVLGFLIGPVLMIITQSLYNVLTARITVNKSPTDV